MCGIVGLVPRQPADPARLEALVRRMANAIVHRGPDDEGFHVTPHIALGLRRLSIIDVARGHQPMSTPNGGKTIVFNGEIYNYRRLRDELVRSGRAFSTESDTEVALASFDTGGERALATLEGMFGLAIWDEGRQQLTLARDPMGQKSIYYTEIEDGWAFASEIKGLLALDAVRRELDHEALSHYMSMRYLPGRQTLFAGIHKLPAAHLARIGATRREFQRYWTPTYQPKWTGTEQAMLDELDQRMAQAVADHLMSEVPLGAFLSGGIDSSLVVAYAAQASPSTLRTFSVGVDEDSQSELPWARAVAERYRTQHLEETVEPDLARLAPSMIAAVEEPVDPFAAGVYIVSRVTARHVTVALGGDGGDELFAGYDRYLGQQLAETYSRLPRPLRHRVLRPLLRLVPESFGYKSLATRLRWLDRMADSDGQARYAESAAFLRFPTPMKARLFGERVWPDLACQESERLLEVWFGDGSAEAFVDRMLHADCMTRLADHLLPIVDRMSMAHSLEARAPFLDRRVVEFAMCIPAQWKLKRRRLKYVARRLGERHLPYELVHRKKQGFGFPLALWFRGRLRPLIQRVVSDSRLVEAGVFRREEMQRLVDEHVGGTIDHNYRLWLLFSVELWYRHYIDREPVEALERWVDDALGG